MQQLILDIRPQGAPTLADYVAGPNGEVLAQLRHWARQNERPPLYLWGPADCGKTHLLKALAAAFNIRSIPTLMVFREQVILFSQAGSLPASALDQLIEQVMSLDMTQVHKEIAEEQAKKQAGQA